MPATIAPCILPVAGAAFVRPSVLGEGIRLYGASSGYVGFKPASAAGSTDYTLPSSPPLSDGYSLVSTAAGVLSWANVVTNPAGSGSELQYRASASAFGATNVHWDAVNSRLGVGTSAPSSKLHVNGGSLYVNNDAAGGNTAVIGLYSDMPVNGTTQPVVLLTPSSTSSYHGTIQSRYRLHIVPGTDGLYIDPAANSVVGIGVPYGGSINAKLDVRSKSASDVAVNVSLASGQTTNALEINSYGGSGGNLAKISSAGYLTIGGIGSIYNTFMTYNAAGQETVAIPNSANSSTLQVGAGTCSTGITLLSLHGGYASLGVYSAGAAPFEIKTYGQDLKLNPGGLSVGGNLIINEGGLDSDVRIEGDTNQNLLFVDASTDRVGIGTASPGRLMTLYDASISILQFATAFTGTGGGRGGLVYHNGSHLVLENQESAGTIKLQATSATQVPATISLASGQSANAFEVNSYGGSGGDRLKLGYDGSVVLGGNSFRYGGGTGPLFSWNGSNVQLDRDFTVVAKIAVENGTTNSLIRIGPWPYTVALGYSSNGILEVNNSTTGQYRDLKLRNLIATGQAYCPQQTLTDAASIAWDLDTQPSGVVTLGGNRALAAPSNQKAGATYILLVKQDATGSRTLTFDATYKFPGGTAPTLTTTASAVDMLTFISDGTYMYGVCQNDLR